MATLISVNHIIHRLVDRVVVKHTVRGIRMAGEPICNINANTLPKKAEHGDEICDRYGNRWYYDAGQDGWISKGTITAPSTVTESSDGIIDPDIFGKLRKLRAFVDTGFDLNPLKILPGKDAYWYYFRSSDKMYRFRAEGEDCLRIEVDKARIFQLLLKEVCPGIRGLKGEKGDDGLDGKPGADEICFMPSDMSGEKMDFAIFTPTPLLDLNGEIFLPNNHIPEISVRLFRVTLPIGVSTSSTSQLQHLNIVFQSMNQSEITNRFTRTREILSNRSMGVEIQEENFCDIAMSPVILIPTGSEFDLDPIVTIEVSPTAETDSSISFNAKIPIDKSRTLNSIQYDPETNIVCGSIYLTTGNWSDISKNFLDDRAIWCIKSLQKGPDGINGKPGECKMKIVECIIDDTNILATCPIINTRLDCDLDIIYTVCADLLDEVCVDKVNLLPNSETLANSTVFKSSFAAVQMTLEECKYVHRYKVILDEDEIPELNLEHWDPQPGCFTKRHFDRHKFNWVPGSDIPACDSVATWFGPGSVRPGKYPGEIHLPSEPADDECCQDNWFYCPNVQDGPCEDEPPS